MSSYLFITLSRGGSFLEVHTSEDGVLTKALLDLQLSLLHTTLLVETSLLLLALLVSGLIVSEEVEPSSALRAWPRESHG